MAERKSTKLEFVAILDHEIDSQRDPTTRGSLTEGLEARESPIRSPHEVGTSQNTLTVPNTEGPISE